MIRTAAAALAFLSATSMAGQDFDPFLIIDDVEKPTPTDSAIVIDLDTLDDSLANSLFQDGVHIRSQDILRFKIRGNPSTGYEWIVNESAINGAFTIKKSFSYHDAPEDYVGVGGTYTFEILAGDETKEGEFSIYEGRSWEPAEDAMAFLQIPIYVLG